MHGQRHPSATSAGWQSSVRPRVSSWTPPAVRGPARHEPPRRPLAGPRRRLQPASGDNERHLHGDL